MFRLISTLLLLFSSTVFATTVYKTVGENGVVSYSDTLPEGGVPSEVLHITPVMPHSADAHLESLEAMRETTDRMAADRREREKHRAELNEIRARSQYNKDFGTVEHQYVDYYPVYPRDYRHKPRPPWHPGYRPKPEHPIVRPPLRPAHRAIGSTNSQLMRPLVSSRNKGSGSANGQLMRPLASSRQ